MRPHSKRLAPPGRAWLRRADATPLQTPLAPPGPARPARSRPAPPGQVPPRPAQSRPARPSPALPGPARSGPARSCPAPPRPALPESAPPAPTRSAGSGRSKQPSVSYPVVSVEVRLAVKRSGRILRAHDSGSRAFLPRSSRERPLDPRDLASRLARSVMACTRAVRLVISPVSGYSATRLEGGWTSPHPGPGLEQALVS
jgi:hypothetical protein